MAWDEAKRSAYLERTKDKRNAQTRKYRLVKRTRLDELKSGPCIDCGNRYPPIVMEFHHRNKEEKLFTPSKALAVTSWKKVLEEIAKCDLLCANCHRLRHNEDGNWGQRNS